MVVLKELDPEYEYLTVRVVGADQPGPTFSQKVGPLKIPGKVVGEEIKKLTAKDYKFQKVHVQLKVKDRKATAELAPTTAQLIVRELKEDRQPKKKGAEKVNGTHEGSLPLTSLFKIAGEIRDRSRAKTLKGTCKEILGTAQAVGCTVEGVKVKDVISAISESRAAFAGLFSVDINSLPEFLDE